LTFLFQDIGDPALLSTNNNDLTYNGRWKTEPKQTKQTKSKES